MRKSRVLLGLSVVALLISGSSRADDIRLEEPSYGGNGCPAGSASVSLAPDAKSLSILFDNYIAEAGGETGKRLDRKSCNVAIPVHVPQGYSVSIIDIDYRGFNYLPSRASSQFNVEYFFAGQRGPRFTKTFRGAIDEDFLLSNSLIASALVWSRCGEDVILRTNTSLRVMTNPRQEEAMASVDSIDARAGVVYHLQWKRCN